MTSNIAARAATAGELVKFRTDGQWSQLGLAIQHPPTVYTARINQTFTTLDGVAELTYDGGSGTLADVLRGMTVWIGSSAGARDRGVCRIRKAPTASIFYINETSEIQFADDDYITVLDMFSIWAREPRNAGGQMLMDYDIPYMFKSQNGGPMPRIGPRAAVLKLAGGSATFAPPDPSLSASYDGATIVSYLYEAPGAATTSNMDTTAPSWTYEAAGEYRWSCTITDNLGGETIAYGLIFVDPTSIDFELDENPTGDFETGGWSFAVTMSDTATQAEIMDRALVVLYSKREFYGATEGSIGKMAGFENIKCWGWIDGESIVYDKLNGEVTFTVQGPGFWLGKIGARPFEMADSSGTASSWNEIQEMTVDKALARLIYWTSTAPSVMDCFFTGDETRVQSLATQSGSLKEQINAIGGRVFAKALVNNYGQMYIEADSQTLSSADQAGLPVVMDITSEDWIEGLEIERTPTARTGMVELGALGEYDGSTTPLIYARAPGNIGKRHGGPPQAYDDHIIATQAECNRIAGCLLAIENNEYEPLEIELAANNALIDIAPRQYCRISVAAGDTPRGIVLTNQKLILRRVELEFDEKVGDMLTKTTFEFAVTGVDGITYYPPQPPQDNLMDGFDDFGFDDFPALDASFPPLVPPPLDLGDGSDAANGPYTIYWNKGSLHGSDAAAEDRTAEAYFPCIIRPDSFANQSSLITRFSTYDPATWDDVTLTAIRNGADVLSIPYTGGIISGVSAVEIDGFRLVLAAGGWGDDFPPLQENSPICAMGAEVASTGGISYPGSATLSGLTPGNWYILRAKGAALTDNLYTIDGIGPLGHVLQAGSSGYIDVTYNGINYANGNRPEGSFGFVVNASIRTHGLLFYAAKSSYTIAMAETTGFGGMNLAAYNATIYFPNVIFLAEGTLFNVSPL